MKITLKVEGMSCGHCVRAVTNALSEVTGVKSVEVSLEKGQAVIQADDGTEVSRLIEAVNEEGYSASQEV